MYQKLFHNKKNKKGFTLIELLVVVAIIGVLSLIGLRVYAIQQEKVKDAIVKGNASTIHTLIQSELGEHALSDVDEAFLNDIVSNSGIRNPYNALDQTLSYYSSPDKPAASTAGEVYVWIDDLDVFHINGWNENGDDVLPVDLTANK
jgi:prepilin-type N-terminal cleavage/methylation domain-containing protein